MSNESNDKKNTSLQVKPGEINLDYIPSDWPLTPLIEKRAYVANWTDQPYTIEQIKNELEQGKATGVGLLTGQWSNSGGLIWVDIDGPEGLKALEELAGSPMPESLPPTLTISSGKAGRHRLLYSIPAPKLPQIPDKATIKIGLPNFEILFRRRQGAIMGLHPDTEGYFTTNHGGFEYAKNPPELPQFLYDAITKAYPTTRFKKQPKAGIITQQINISYEEGSEYAKSDEIDQAKIYLDHLNLQRAVEYDEWLTIGMALHQVDDCLLKEWVDWSSQAENFEDGVCEQKWSTFERVEGTAAPEGSA